MTNITIGISVPEKTLQKIDQSRGLVKRSTYINNLLEKALATDSEDNVK